MLMLCFTGFRCINCTQNFVGISNSPNIMSVMALVSDAIAGMSRSLSEYPTMVGANTMAMFGNGILTAGHWATRCRCWMRKASVSRFAGGIRFTVSCICLYPDPATRFAAAFAKMDRISVGMRVSLSDLRKSLRQPHSTGMLVDDSWIQSRTIGIRTY